MHDDEIARQVQDQLANGRLRRLYVAVDATGTASMHMTIGGGPLDDSCSVCGEGATDFRYDTTPSAAFHESCHAVWQERVRSTTHVPGGTGSPCSALR